MYNPTDAIASKNPQKLHIFLDFLTGMSFALGMSACKCIWALYTCIPVYTISNLTTDLNRRTLWFSLKPIFAKFKKI